MPSLNSARHNLPLLAVAQAQKEITHNEALTRIDSLLNPVIVGFATEPPPLTESDAGKCWVVGADATAEWAGNEGCLANWTGFGWRFQRPVAGMQIWLKSENAYRIWTEDVWLPAAVISDPQGGTSIDAEARAALVALLDHMRRSGFLRE